MFTYYDIFTSHVYGKTRILLENKDLPLNIICLFVLNYLVWSCDNITSSPELVSFQKFRI